MSKLFTRHALGFTTEYQNGAQDAETTDEIMLGTPGTIDSSVRSSGTYFYRRFYDALGKLRESYLGGPAGTPEGDAAFDAARLKIEHASMQVDFVKKMRKLGFHCLHDKVGATLAALHNQGLFNGGLTLVGSHAFGVIVNSLGIATQGLLTEDIDLVRMHKLHLVDDSVSMLTTLQSSGLPFMQASTGLSPQDKSSVFKLPGKDRLLVDFLVNGDEVGKAVLIPEIDAYAQALPNLDYLIEGKMRGIAMAKNYVVPVYAPKPERFAVHKLFSSQSRTNQYAKSEKDIRQAATVIAAVEENFSGDIADAMQLFPAKGMEKMLQGARAAVKLVADHDSEIGEGFANAIDLCQSIHDRSKSEKSSPKKRKP